MPVLVTDQGVGHLVQDRVPHLGIGVQPREGDAQPDLAPAGPAYPGSGLGAVEGHLPVAEAVLFQQLLGERDGRTDLYVVFLAVGWSVVRGRTVDVPVPKP